MATGYRTADIKLPAPYSREIPINTIASLREHLQAALHVEFYSIPLYLFGGFTVTKQTTKDPKTPAGIVHSQ